MVTLEEKINIEIYDKLMIRDGKRLYHDLIK